MDLSDEIDAKTRTINKFYARIRSHLDDLVLLEPERARPVTEQLKNIKEENKYGLVEQSEFDHFLKAYEKQPNKTVKCDQLLATSLSKLLFSKPGFHNASSTPYLIEDLRINDFRRNSFLGGHSVYSTKRENSIPQIRKSQTKMYIEKESKRILDELDAHGLENILYVHIQDLVKHDDRNADTYAAEGCFRVLDRSVRDNHKIAISLLKQALEKNTCHTQIVQRYLAKALFEEGFKKYVGGKLEDAHRDFEEVLKHDPQNDSAVKHLELCNRKMLTHQPLPFGHAQKLQFQQYNQRRK